MCFDPIRATFVILVLVVALGCGDDVEESAPPPPDGPTVEDAVAKQRLHESGQYDLSQIALDPDLETLRDHSRFEALLMRPEDFRDPGASS